MLETISAFWAEYGTVLTDGVWDTLFMVVVSTVFAYLIGVPLQILAVIFFSPWKRVQISVRRGKDVPKE